MSEDVIAAILGNLDARDLARAAATSRGWKRCTSSRPLWRAIYARDFLGHVPSAACSAVASANGRNPGDHHALLPGSLGSAPSAAAAAVIGRGIGGGSGDLSTWSTLGRFAPSGHPQSYNPFGGPGGLGRRFDRNVGGNALGGTNSLGIGGGNAGGIGGSVSGGGGGLFFWGGGGSSSSNSSGVFYSAPTGIGVCPALEENPKEQYAKQLTERRARLERQQKVRTPSLARLCLPHLAGMISVFSSQLRTCSCCVTFVNYCYVVSVSGFDLISRHIFHLLFL